MLPTHPPARLPHLPGKTILHEARTWQQLEEKMQHTWLPSPSDVPSSLGHRRERKRCPNLDTRANVPAPALSRHDLARSRAACPGVDGDFNHGNPVSIHRTSNYCRPGPMIFRSANPPTAQV